MASRKPGLALALGLAVLLGAASARAGLSDSEIQTLVEVSLRDNVVASQVERIKAEMIARTTFGVLGVENRLRVEGR